MRYTRPAYCTRVKRKKKTLYIASEKKNLGGTAIILYGFYRTPWELEFSTAVWVRTPRSVSKYSGAPVSPLFSFLFPAGKCNFTVYDIKRIGSGIRRRRVAPRRIVRAVDANSFPFQFIITFAVLLLKKFKSNEQQVISYLKLCIFKYRITLVLQYSESELNPEQIFF